MLLLELDPTHTRNVAELGSYFADWMHAGDENIYNTNSSGHSMSRLEKGWGLAQCDDECEEQYASER